MAIPFLYNAYFAGKVGIGETNPTEKLEINGQFGKTTLNGHVIAYTRASANYLWAKSVGGDLRFTVNGNGIGSPSMILSTAGNLGIGTVSPERKLHVQSGSAGTVTSSSETPLVVESSLESGISLLSPDSRQSSLYFGSPSDNIGGQLAWKFNDKLLVLGTAVTSGGEVSIRTGNNIERLRIDSSGNSTFTGSVTANTATLTSGTNRLLTLDYTAGSGSYTWASFKQSGTEQFRIFGSYTDNFLKFFNDQANISQLVLNSDGSSIFAGLVSGITPVAAANFVTKAYVDGSGGGTGPFLPLAGGTMSGNINFNDDVFARFGNGFDLDIGHDASNSRITHSGVGNLIIQNTEDNSDIRFMSDDGSGGTATYFIVDGSEVETGFFKTTHHYDNVQARFGDGNDLKIYHDGSNSFIDEAGTGNLFIRSNVIQIRKYTGEDMITCLQDNAVTLYFDNSPKLATSNTGVTVTGGGIFTGNLNVNGDATLGDGSTDNHTINGQVIQLTADALGYKLQRSNGGTGFLISATSDAQVQFGTDNGSGTDTTQWTIGKDGTDNSFRISNSASLGTSDALTINSSGNATFAGDINILGDDINFSTNGFADINNTGTGAIRIRPSGTTLALTLTGTNATIAGKATSTQTAASDSSITLTTKSYVDGLVTGVPVYKGTWDARTQAEGGLAGDGGNINLRLAANKVLGNYYIVDTAGSATPNGAGTEPDSWNVGDWCIFSDVTPGAGTDLWQKIDNTSVISGAGTGQKVTKWAGAGPSETLTDGPITFSGNNSTFGGNVTAPNLIATTAVYSSGIVYGSNTLSLKKSNGNSYVDFDTNLNATFAGNVALTGGSLSISGDGSNAVTFTESSAGIMTIAAPDDIILDAGGDIAFDAGGDDIRFRVNGTTYGSINDASSNLNIYSSIQDKSIKFLGNDGGTTITALVLNMADGGDATFTGKAYGVTPVAADLGVMLATKAYADGLTPGAGVFLPLAGGTMNSGAAITFNVPNAGGSFINIDHSGNESWTIAAQSGVGVDDYLDIGISGGTRAMSWHETGRVGIGTTSPDGDLEVIASTVVSGASDSVNNVLIGLQSANRPTIILDTADTTYTNRTWNITNVGSAGKLFIGRNGLDVMVMDNDGNVGIGTGTPESKLHIRTSTDHNLEFEEVSSELRIAALNDARSANIGLQFAASKFNFISGNVGIGMTTNPGAQLHNYSTSATDVWISGYGTLAQNDWRAGHAMFVAQDNGLLISKANANNNTNRLFSLYHDAQGNAEFYMYDTTSTNKVYLNTSGDSYLNGGNVGIGVTGPQSKLQVAGGIQMADDTASPSATKVGTMRYRTGTENVEVTGIELVTNGNFASDTNWTKGTGWTISGGKGNGASAGGDLTQTISIPINKTYRVKYTISNYSAGIFRVILGGYVAGTNRAANGTYTDIISVTNVSSNSLLYLAGDISAVTLSIDDVSVMEITQEDASYADMCMQTGASTYEWVNIVRNTY